MFVYGVHRIFHVFLETPPNAKELLEQRKRERTIVNYLLGTDGQIYRGRYKMVTTFNFQQFSNLIRITSLLKVKTFKAEVTMLKCLFLLCNRLTFVPLSFIRKMMAVFGQDQLNQAHE